MLGSLTLIFSQEEELQCSEREKSMVREQLTRSHQQLREKVNHNTALPPYTLMSLHNCAGRRSNKKGDRAVKGKGDNYEREAADYEIETEG